MSEFIDWINFHKQIYIIFIYHLVSVESKPSCNIYIRASFPIPHNHKTQFTSSRNVWCHWPLLPLWGLLPLPKHNITCYLNVTGPLQTYQDKGALHRYLPPRLSWEELFKDERSWMKEHMTSHLEHLSYLKMNSHLLQTHELFYNPEDRSVAIYKVVHYIVFLVLSRLVLNYYYYNYLV